MGHITGLALSDMFGAFGRKMIEINVRDFLGDTSINKGMRRNNQGRTREVCCLQQRIDHRLLRIKD